MRQIPFISSLKVHQKIPWFLHKNDIVQWRVQCFFNFFREAHLVPQWRALPLKKAHLMLAQQRSLLKRLFSQSPNPPVMMPWRNTMRRPPRMTTRSSTGKSIPESLTKSCNRRSNEPWIWPQMEPPRVFKLQNNSKRTASRWPSTNFWLCGNAKRLTLSFFIIL